MHFIKRVKQINLLFIFTLFVVFSCENHVQENDLAEGVECDPNTSFTTSIKPIIDNNCVECHGGSRFPNLSTYSGVSANANIVLEEVESGRMPTTGPLSIEQIDLIKCWVENGALDN